MDRRSLHVVITLFSAFALVLSSVVTAGAAPPVADPKSYIVVLRDDIDSQAVAREHANAHALSVAFVYEHALKGYAARIPPDRLARIKADSRVLFVSEDREVQAFDQTVPTGVDRADADVTATDAGDAGNGSGEVNVDIAILDTGIDGNHSDLNVAGGYNCTTPNRRAWSDGHGHGSHVAGTAAAKDDSNGVVGTAPGARLWAVKVLNNAGSGTWSGVICGIDWVTANSGTIEVANMSLGGSGSDDGNCGNTNNDALHRAICKSVGKGMTYVVAAGNSGVDASGFVPAAYDEVITVSALADYNGEPDGSAAPTCRSDSGADDTFAPWSNYGADVDIGAPGVCISSTYKGGGYATMSGTSMASPHVAGAAALYKMTQPDATPGDVKTALTTNGEALGAGHTDPSGNHLEPVLQMDTF